MCLCKYDNHRMEKPILRKKAGGFQNTDNGHLGCGIVTDFFPLLCAKLKKKVSCTFIITNKITFIAKFPLKDTYNCLPRYMAFCMD